MTPHETRENAHIRWSDTLALATIALFIIALGLSCTGCAQSRLVRYNAQGQKWAEETRTFFLVRGSASKVSEEITENGAGEYKRAVKIGQVNGENELDKITDLLREANKLKAP